MRLSLPSSFPWRRPHELTAWRPNANSVLRGLIGLCALLLCWQLAGLLAQILGWQSAHPALALPAPPATDNSAARTALTRWFASAEADKPASSTAGLQLIAVVAGKHGVALLSGVENAPSAHAVGTEVRPGLRLLEVLPDKVIFEQAGARSELAFPAAPANLIASPGLPAPAAKPTLAAAASAPETVVSTGISRGQMAGIAQGGNLGDWDKGLANFASGGIRVTSAQAQPLAKVLNLRDGDIIQRVNGRDLKQLADISLIYHHFSQSPEVTLTILRDGKPQQLNFKIQP
ncbi:PDZ domain-containing protein [Uliginosibacterium sp. 31-16]|uniref:type II secretion system protein N n=1 Tax=Uliginosibacterium sp. 31-16 TaxID=3068315 RepID=UPI00273D541E|nr:type II secretion system protein N [Uliginosibacterium sp. 31-16]MDP5240926.1 PDZ domain-containing protein [Uliginosibacterium sp. 31-16]